MFLLVPAYPGCPGSKAVKRSLLLLLLLADNRLIPIIGKLADNRRYRLSADNRCTSAHHHVVSVLTSDSTFFDICCFSWVM